MRQPVKRLSVALLAGLLLGLAVLPSSTLADVMIWTRSTLAKLTITQGPLVLSAGAIGLGVTPAATISDGTVTWNATGDTGPSIYGGSPTQLLFRAGTAGYQWNNQLNTTAEMTLSNTGDLQITQPAITVGSGTGVTVNNTSSVRTVVYKVTVLRTNCVAAATTCDLTVATLPAKTMLLRVFADLTVTYACTAVCTTATLSGTLGTTAGGTELLASMDLDAATTQFGDLDAELGSSVNAAARAANGPSISIGWSGTTTVTYRITSGTGNLGDGAATNLSQGTAVFYLVTEVFP